MSDSKSWEERFDYNFVVPDRVRTKDGNILEREKFATEINMPKKVKQFITQLLHQTRQDTLDEVMGKVDQLILIDATPEYNQGLLDAIKIIDKLKQQLTEMKGEV
jgi:hypothetical protein